MAPSAQLLDAAYTCTNPPAPVLALMLRRDTETSSVQNQRLVPSKVSRGGTKTEIPYCTAQSRFPPPGKKNASEPPTQRDILVGSLAKSEIK